MSGKPLLQYAVSISVSESPDMTVLGFSDIHLQDAMVEVARHLLAMGALLVYGGDLRSHGFTELLFELVARHHRDTFDEGKKSSVCSYLPWPVHINLNLEAIGDLMGRVDNIAEIFLLDLDGHKMDVRKRPSTPVFPVSNEDWSRSLTNMRRVITKNTNARIILGGRTEGYKGSLPGIAEEALQSLEAGQPLFILGAFGGCARDILETMSLVSHRCDLKREWPAREAFSKYTVDHLCNGLNEDENNLLAVTPHINEAIILILRGLMRLEDECEGHSKGAVENI